LFGLKSILLLAQFNIKLNSLWEFVRYKSS